MLFCIHGCVIRSPLVVVFIPGVFSFEAIIRSIPDAVKNKGITPGIGLFIIIGLKKCGYSHFKSSHPCKPGGLFSMENRRG